MLVVQFTYCLIGGFKVKFVIAIHDVMVVTHLVHYKVGEN